MNPFAAILLLTAGVLVLKGSSIVKTGKQSTIKLLSIDSLRIEGIEFVLTVTAAIDNPTSNTLTVQQPYLKLLYNDSEIANSRASATKVTIKANDRTPIKGINLRMSFSSLPVLAVAVFDKKQSSQNITLQTSTVVDGFPITDKQTYPISDLVKLITKK